MRPPRPGWPLSRATWVPRRPTIWQWKAPPRPERIAQARALVRSHEEEIRRLQDLLGKHTIRAPFQGYVVRKHTEVGAWIRQGEPLAEVVELDPVEIEISVPETHIASLEVGTVQPV